MGGLERRNTDCTFENRLPKCLENNTGIHQFGADFEEFIKITIESQNDRVDSQMEGSDQ